MENKDQPAFPNEVYKELGEDAKNGFRAMGGYNPTGLSKREYFAAMAMQGILANSEFLIGFKEVDIHTMAVKQADYLLKELEK